MNAEKQKVFIQILILVIVGICIYSNSLSIGVFHWDDKSAIQTNPLMHQPINLVQIFQRFNTRFIPGLSFVLNAKYFGMNVFSFRVVNVIIHISTSLLVYLFLKVTLVTPYIKKTLRSQHFQIIPISSALLFLVHPIQTESINLLTQRFTLMGAFFYILAMLFYAAARLKNSKIFYYLSFLATISAMFSKEFCFTLPWAIVLYEYLFFNDQKHKSAKRILIFIPFLCTMLIIPFLLFKPTTSMTPTAKIAKAVPSETNNPESFFKQMDRITRTEAEISRKNYFLTQLHVLRTYVRLLFWPSNQNLDYDYPITKDFWNLPTVVSTLFLLAIFTLAIVLRNKFRLITFGIFWFFLTLSVESSIIPIGYVINEHRLYLPMLGFATIISTFVVSFLTRQRVLYAILLITILSLCAATYRRNEVWQNEIILWQDTCKKSPMKARPLDNLGIAYKDNKEYEKAIKCFTQSIKLKPDNFVAYTQMAFCFRYKGNVTKEAELLQKAIKLNPHYSLAHFGLAYHYQLQGMLEEAIQYYEKALILDPNLEAIYKNLAIAYLKNEEAYKIKKLIAKLKTHGNTLLAKKLGNFLKDLQL